MFHPQHYTGVALVHAERRGEFPLATIGATGSSGTAATGRAIVVAVDGAFVAMIAVVITTTAITFVIVLASAALVVFTCLAATTAATAAATATAIAEVVFE
jgi:hypothetical protein